MKKGFKFRVNIYSALAAWGAIIFGVVMTSGLFIFFGLALLLVVFLGLRNAIYSEPESPADVQGKDGSLLYEFSAE